MKWKTKFTEITGVKYPIIMGAFAGLGRAEFAAEFSNAGGLGIITALNYRTAEKFRSALKKAKSITENPFGVNFSILPPDVRNKNPKAPSIETYLYYLDVALEEGVKVFTTSAYKAKEIGDKIHEANCYWFHKCANMNHAISAEKDGADFVTLVGLEGTGFKNPYQNTTLINITMAKRILNIPIIAAGGIGDERGFLAALAMGAEAVCFGTAVMATKECPASKRIKEKIISQDIFDEEYYKKIYHFSLKDKPIWSPASGHVKKTLSLKEFIANIIEGTENILQSWGYNNDLFSTL
ncbi:MAG: Nitronate monooxygenase [Promethearchaeota archaeon]|nr:MAG: Nitronate monooxygenase [Candidatus Lokiarchaeota archaeon]